MPESIESSKFVSLRARTTGEFNSRKDLHSTKLKQRPQIFVKLSFSGVVVITTAQIHSTKPELGFCAGSNPAPSVLEIRDGEDL